MGGLNSAEWSLTAIYRFIQNFLSNSKLLTYGKAGWRGGGRCPYFAHKVDYQITDLTYQCLYQN